MKKGIQFCRQLVHRDEYRMDSFAMMTSVLPTWTHSIIPWLIQQTFHSPTRMAEKNKKPIFCVTLCGLLTDFYNIPSKKRTACDYVASLREHLIEVSLPSENSTTCHEKTSIWDPFYHLNI